MSRPGGAGTYYELSRTTKILVFVGTAGMADFFFAKTSDAKREKADNADASNALGCFGGGGCCC